MGFDSKQFLKMKFAHRTEDVPVPDLQQFFPEGEEAVWKIRGLTGQELGRVKEAPERHKKMTGILEGLLSSVTKDVVDGVKAVMGSGTADSPDDIVIRMEQLVMGSIEPKCTLDLAVKLCEVSAITFFHLTNKITILTGQGQMPGKPRPSGETTESGQALPSATPEGDSSLK
jgi:hypothetical protein